MLLIKTLYLGCDNDKSIPDLDNSEIELISEFDTHTYCEMIYHLGKLFFKVERLQSKSLIDKPYKLSIIFPKVEKFKEQDGETNLDRWEFICKNFVPTSKGIIISFYVSDVKQDKIKNSRGALFNWPYKKQWNKNNADDYVVLQDISELVNHNTKKQSNKEMVDDYLEAHKKIVNELKSLEIKYELVSYATPIKKLFDLLLKCKVHITHGGGSYYIASGMNTPTLNYGPYSSDSSKIIIPEKAGGRKTDRKIVRTLWGENYLKSWNVFHYDIQNGIYQKEQSYVTNIGMIENEDYKTLKEKLTE
jgi:hypothetical protein